jgi:hypothetical protein
MKTKAERDWDGAIAILRRMVAGEKLRFVPRSVATGDTSVLAGIRDIYLGNGKANDVSAQLAYAAGWIEFDEPEEDAAGVGFCSLTEEGRTAAALSPSVKESPDEA